MQAVVNGPRKPSMPERIDNGRLDLGSRPQIRKKTLCCDERGARISRIINDKYPGGLYR